MNDGVLVKRVGIVLLVVSIILLLSAAFGGVLTGYLWFGANNEDESIGGAIGAIFMILLAIIIGFGSLIVLVIGALNLVTSITLLKSGTDLNVLKNKRKRIIFANIVLYVTGVIFIITGFGLFVSDTIPLAIVSLAVGIVTFVLGVYLSKALKTIYRIRAEEAK